MADKTKNVGGRPRKAVGFSTLKFGKSQKKVSVKMQDRKAVETLCESQIEELQNDFSEMKADAKVIAGCLRLNIQNEVKDKGTVDKGLLENFEKAQNRVRHICKDQSAILAMLMRQFELFSALDRPMDDDPIFTPVEIVIEGEPPAEALAVTQFTLDESDIEPQGR